MTTKYLEEEWDKFQRDLFKMLLNLRRRINWVSIHHQGRTCAEDEHYVPCNDEILSEMDTIELLQLANNIMLEIIKRNESEEIPENE